MKWSVRESMQKLLVYSVYSTILYIVKKIKSNMSEWNLAIILGFGIFMLTRMFDLNFEDFSQKSSFIVGVMATSGAIFAISVVTFEAMLTQIESKYTHSIQKFIQEKFIAIKVTKAFLICAIISCVISIFTPTDYSDLIVRIIVSFFTAGIVFLIFAIHDLSLIRNPKRIMKKLTGSITNEVSK